jgi:hypothetical protein
MTVIQQRRVRIGGCLTSPDITSLAREQLETNQRFGNGSNMDNPEPYIGSVLMLSIDNVEITVTMTLRPAEEESRLP